MKINQITESRDMCNVCGQTPCNCTHISEGRLHNPGEQDSPVAQAIIRRILLQRTDLLARYGPGYVGQAVDDVADSVGDVEEIGSSDVSGWVKQVEWNLKNKLNQYDEPMNIGDALDEQGMAEDAEPIDREFHLVKKLGRLGERIVQNPRLWERYSEAIDTGNNDWIIGLIQDGTGADKTEVMKLAQLFGEIGGGLGRLVDFAWAVKEGTWKEDFMNPYRQHRAQGVAEGIEIVDQDSDLDQQVYTLNVDGNKVSFTYWDYENNFQSPDIKDIYQQATEQLGRKLSPDQIKDVARAVFKSFEQGVAEMDKSQPSHGRDGRISHSTYGSRDKGGSAGPERTAKATTADKMMKHAHDVMMKSMSDADKVKKGWRNPNVKEQGVAEGRPKEKEADYGSDYQDMVARVKKLAGMGPLKTVYDPQKRVYKNVPVAVQPPQQPKK